MTALNAISFIGIFGLCAIAWLFSENRNPKYFPWRVVVMGILLQLALGALVFIVPITRDILQGFSNVLNVVFDAADAGARFVFGPNIVPVPNQQPAVNLGYIFAFRALPAVIFFSGFMALLYNLGIIQVITNLFAIIFYRVMRLSGAESLSGAANIFVGIEAALVVKPFLAKMTRSELLAILACCFGTAASSTLAIYVNFLRPVFPNILGHLVSASIMAIPACFVLSKIFLPETELPLTAGSLPQDDALLEDENVETTIDGERIERVSPMDAMIAGVMDGVRMAIAIAAVLILILGLVYLINAFFGWLTDLPEPVGGFFKVVTLQNILGALFLPLTVLTGVSLDWPELWASSVIIGRRLFETAIPPYQSLALAADQGILSDRALVIVSYALSGFAHLASVGIFVGGVAALIPSRRKDVSELGWKALFIGTLATLMIACVAGVYYGLFGITPRSILGEPAPQTTPPSPTSPASPATPAPAGTPSSPVPVSPGPAPVGGVPSSGPNAISPEPMSFLVAPRI